MTTQILIVVVGVLLIVLALSVHGKMESAVEPEEGKSKIEYRKPVDERASWRIEVPDLVVLEGIVGGPSGLSIVCDPNASWARNHDGDVTQPWVVKTATNGEYGFGRTLELAIKECLRNETNHEFRVREEAERDRRWEEERKRNAQKPAPPDCCKVK